MTDQFSSELNHLIQVARSRIGHIDSSIEHCNALAERYQQLQEAIDRADSCRDHVRAHMIRMLQEASPAERSDAMEYDRRRVA